MELRCFWPGFLPFLLRINIQSRVAGREGVCKKGGLRHERSRRFYSHKDSKAQRISSSMCWKENLVKRFYPTAVRYRLQGSILNQKSSIIRLAISYKPQASRNPRSNNRTLRCEGYPPFAINRNEYYILVTSLEDNNQLAAGG